MNRGKISIAFNTANDYNTLVEIFKDFVPQHVDTNICTSVTTYWGEHKDFEKVPFGCEVPEYLVILHTDLQGKIYKREFKKI